MKYKKGDKVVFKIDETDASDLNRGHSLNFYEEQFLGRLEEFLPPEKKITMTMEEKKEFNKLYVSRMNCWGIYDYLEAIRTQKYPLLRKKLFLNKSIAEDFKQQVLFLNALIDDSAITMEPDKVLGGTIDTSSIKVGNLNNTNKNTVYLSSKTPTMAKEGDRWTNGSIMKRYIDGSWVIDDTCLSNTDYNEELVKSLLQEYKKVVSRIDLIFANYIENNNVSCISDSVTQIYAVLVKQEGNLLQQLIKLKAL